MLDNSGVPEDERLDRLAKALYDRYPERKFLGTGMKLGSAVSWAHRYFFNTEYSYKDVLQILRSVVYIAIAENPSGEDEAILLAAQHKALEWDEALQCMQENRHKRNRRVGVRKWASSIFRGDVLPWGAPVEYGFSSAPDRGGDDAYVAEAVAPEQEDPTTEEYEEVVGGMDVSGWLEKLMDKGMDSCLALCIVLHYGYAYSVPRIVTLLGYPEKELGPKEFRKICDLVRNTLGDNRKRVTDLLSDHELRVVLQHYGRTAGQDT
jgi:hypothetical protein